MPIPYTREETVVVANNGDVVAFKFPGRCTLHSVCAVRLGGGAITFGIYSRALATAPQPIGRTVSNAAGKAVYLLPTALPVRVGDVVYVTACSEEGYNTLSLVAPVTAIRVTAVDLNLQQITTDQDYIADSLGGTINLAIPEAEQGLYLVDDMTGTDTAETLPMIGYVNRDPLPNSNTGINRALYLKFANAATYRLAVTGDESTGQL